MLDADPSRDLGALRAISAVITDGRYYSADRLKQMLAKAAEAAKKQPQPN